MKNRKSKWFSHEHSIGYHLKKFFLINPLPKILTMNSFLVWMLGATQFSSMKSLSGSLLSKDNDSVEN